MNVLSLFDGMSCGQIALERAGIKYDNYYASEIDKYAIKVTMANYPNTIQLGSVVGLQAPPDIDLLIGGSPCQGFSFAGKQLAFDDPRSKLFFEWVRIWKECKPKWWLLENVKMKKESEQIISNILGCKPYRINSNLVSAQNRERLYWTNIPVIASPDDKKVILKNILQQNVDDIYFLTDKSIDRIKRKVYSSPLCNPDKSGTINTKNNSGQLSIDSGTTLITDNAKGRHPEIRKVLNAPPLRSHPGCGWDNKIFQQSRGYNKGGEKSLNGKTPSLSSSSWQHNNHLLTKHNIRRLTEIECERLQTVPDNYTNHVSSTQRYKMLGNGWTVDIVAHFFKHIPQ